MLLRKTTVSILSILISSCSIGPGSSKTEMGNQLGSYFSLLSVETYEGCHELESSIQAQLQERADNDFERALYHVKHSPKDHPYHDIDIYDVLAPQQDSMAGGAAAGAEPEQFTNIQEEGIDEPDFIKVGSHFIFVAKGKNSLLQIVSHWMLLKRFHSMD